SEEGMGSDLATQGLAAPFAPAAANLPVTVTNGAGNPVPTTVQGGVNVLSMPSVIGTVTCEQSAPYDTNILGTPNVNVVSMPQVAVAGTPNVNIVALPQVQLAGTPTVNVANFPQGQGGGTTVLAYSNRMTLTRLQFVSIDPVDISAYRDVRVIVNGLGVTDWQFYIYAVDDVGIGRNLLLDGDIIQGNGDGTRLYTMPGKRIAFV